MSSLNNLSRRLNEELESTEMIPKDTQALMDHVEKGYKHVVENIRELQNEGIGPDFIFTEQTKDKSHDQDSSVLDNQDTENIEDTESIEMK